MKINSHNRLYNSVRWRAIFRFEVGQSQAVKARWLEVASRFWNQIQTNGIQLLLIFTQSIRFQIY